MERKVRGNKQLGSAPYFINCQHTTTVAGEEDGYSVEQSDKSESAPSRSSAPLVAFLVHLVFPSRGVIYVLHSSLSIYL